MKDRIRVVLDTNVPVSALFSQRSPPSECLKHVVRFGVMLASKEILAEYEIVMARPKLDRFVSKELRRSLLESITARVDLVEVKNQISICRDPKDDKFLEVAVEGRAKYLISGDRDLLLLNPFEGIMILDPTSYLLSVEGALQGEDEGTAVN
jgi:uncharacterized protein